MTVHDLVHDMHFSGSKNLMSRECMTCMTFMETFNLYVSI